MILPTLPFLAVLFTPSASLKVNLKIKISLAGVMACFATTHSASIVIVTGWGFHWCLPTSNVAALVGFVPPAGAIRERS